jgi:hypothetical protein
MHFNHDPLPEGVSSMLQNFIRCVLAAMDPPAAAERFPGPSRPQLLLLMGADVARPGWVP